MAVTVLGTGQISIGIFVALDPLLAFLPFEAVVAEDD
jgi:hypothetical protein